MAAKAMLAKSPRGLMVIAISFVDGFDGKTAQKARALAP
jgi:hypothetical protein